MAVRCAAGTDGLDAYAEFSMITLTRYLDSRRNRPWSLRMPSPNDAAAVEVVVRRLDLAISAVKDMNAVLTDGEKERAAQFFHDRDRRRYIVSRASLRQLLAARLGTVPQLVKLTTGKRGKPALAPGFSGPDLRFNLAHSGDVAVFAFATGCEVGVDIEEMRDIPDMDAIAASFFSRRENEAYRALRPGERKRAFFDCWTRKEAFIKALGEGVYFGLDRFDVSLEPGEHARMLRVDCVSGDHCGWQLRDFAPCDGFAGAVVVQTLTGDAACSMTASA